MIVLIILTLKAGDENVAHESYFPLHIAQIACIYWECFVKALPISNNFICLHLELL